MKFSETSLSDQRILPHFSEALLPETNFICRNSWNRHSGMKQNNRSEIQIE